MTRGVLHAFALSCTLGACARDTPPIELPTVVVRSPLRLPGAMVLGARQGWHVAPDAAPPYGNPVPVELTAFCLTRATTPRGRGVQAGVVAADRRLFPRGRYVELFLGRRHLGRFLIDDTGRPTTGNRIDMWMPTCRDARVFGRRRGTAVLVPVDSTAAAGARR
ncbi:MAG: 3D domain-containing protein [Gemmatimonadaceae bacterium]